MTLSSSTRKVLDSEAKGGGKTEGSGLKNGSSGSGDRYRRLPTGSHKLDREFIERDQRERLQAAMVELIAKHGYQALRITDLTNLAHISRPTFYSLYSDKEDLLMSAYRDVSMHTAEAVMSAYATDGTLYERMQVAMRAFAELVASEQDAMSLFLLGAFGAGGKVLRRRARMLESFEDAVEEARDQAKRRPATNHTVKVIVGGIREVAAARLLEGRAEEMPAIADELTAWAASYPRKLPSGLHCPAAVRRDPDEHQERTSERARRAEGRLPSGRHDLSREFVIKNQRERIVDATAAIVAEKGLAGLTIPEIASRASVSHETFYEMYPTKQEAFVGAQKVGMHQAFVVAVGAYERIKQESWPRGIAEGLRALINYLHEERAHAHLSIVDTFAASPETLVIRAELLKGFAYYFQPPERPAELGADAPPITAEAVVGGCWQVLHHYVENGSFDELVEATPQLAYMLLTPFIGPKEAAKVARRPPAGSADAVPGGS